MPYTAIPLIPNGLNSLSCHWTFGMTSTEFYYIKNNTIKSSFFTNNITFIILMLQVVTMTHSILNLCKQISYLKTMELRILATHTALFNDLKKWHSPYYSCTLARFISLIVMVSPDENWCDSRATTLLWSDKEQTNTVSAFILQFSFCKLTSCHWGQKGVTQRHLYGPVTDYCC